jgi:hypothetical protein
MILSYLYGLQMVSDNVTETERWKLMKGRIDSGRLSDYIVAEFDGRTMWIRRLLPGPMYIGQFQIINYKEVYRCEVYGEILFLHVITNDGATVLITVDLHNSCQVVGQWSGKIGLLSSPYSSCLASGRFITPSSYCIWTSRGRLQMLNWPQLEPLDDITVNHFAGNGYATYAGYMYDCIWMKKDLVLTTHLYEDVRAYNLSKQTQTEICNLGPGYGQVFYIAVPYMGRTLLLPSQWHTSHNCYYECKETKATEWPEFCVVGRLLSTDSIQITQTAVKDCYQLVDGHLFVALATVGYDKDKPLSKEKHCLVIDLATGPDLDVQISKSTTWPDSTRLLCCYFGYM